MKSKSAFSMKQFTRQLVALMLSVMVIPVALLDLYAQDAPQAAYAPLDAVALDQLVSPIALYPDALVAQVLTASTYPDQVAEADSWSQQNAGLPPEQRASIADGMAWDPSVKALIAFPSVLDNLARNATWTSQLGNAYYNQPADVMNAVQATRIQAQQAGVLKSSPQQRVYDDNGAVIIAPVDPNLVYVPYYNPWGIWGPGFAAYPGFYVMPPPRGIVLGLGIGFAAGISIGLFGHYGWGWGAWGPNWRGGGVFFNHGAYFSHSVTVYNHGHFGGYNRGVFEHEGRGVPGGFHPVVTRAGFRPGGPAGRPEARPGARPGAAGARPEARPGARPGAAGARPEARPGTRPGAGAGARPEAGARPGAGAGARPGGAGRAPAGRAAPAAHAPAGHAAPAAHAAGGGGKRK